jgi:hypothetical protein
LVDLKLFNIFVRETRVRKGYDWLVLPDGRRVSIPPGKYMRITANSFAFEDMTEEVGEKPDYDFDEPYCVVSESGFVAKTVRLDCVIGSSRTIDLYYGERLVAAGLTGYRALPPIHFVEVSIPELLLAVAAGAGAVALLVAVLTRKL